MEPRPLGGLEPRSLDATLPWIPQLGSGPLPAFAGGPIVTVTALVTAMTNPLDLLAEERLGLRVSSSRHDTDDDLIPVGLTGLDSWAVAQQLLDADASGAGRDEVLAWSVRAGTSPRSIRRGRSMRPLSASMPCLLPSPVISVFPSGEPSVSGSTYLTVIIVESKV